MNIRPTDADYELACMREALVQWKRIKDRARLIAAGRLAKECLDEMGRLSDAATALTGPAWLKNMADWDAAAKRHDELMAIAHPEPRS